MMRTKTRSAWSGLLIGLATAMTLSGVASAQSTRYVDADAAPGGDGLGWGTAYRYLQDALVEAALSAGVIEEIRVAQGTYQPDLDDGGAFTPGDRQVSFQLLDGVALRGGYAGAGEPQPDARDIEGFATILTGDLLGDDGPGWFADYEENSWHVVDGSGTDATALLEGFVITHGYANGPYFPDDYHGTGGGMLTVAGSPTVSRCTFSSHGSFNGGSGMANAEGSSPHVSDCVFEHNHAVDGAAIANWSLNAPTIQRCTFRFNTASGAGTILNYSSSPDIIDCFFHENTVELSGGGIFSWDDSHPTISGCTFTGNEARWGGGVADTGGSWSRVIGCV
ncbi:MAG: right-handed parallel beta-helix repeat-containing protein, partial [Planctomycetota bacterium]